MHKIMRAWPQRGGGREGKEADYRVKTVDLLALEAPLNVVNEGERGVQANNIERKTLMQVREETIE